MNGNIEIINEYCWGVNQHYVKSGYIKELSTLEGMNPETHAISLTDKGILILNKGCSTYEIIKKFVPKIMEHTEEQLAFAIKKMQRVENPDAYVKMYLNVLEWEIKRRCVMAEYLGSQTQPTFKDRIKKTLGR